MRLEARFRERIAERRTTLVMYLAASDPDPATTLMLMNDLVAAGVDVIEVGYPFSDPILDGPTLQRANRRALDAGGNMQTTLDIVARFRSEDAATPIVLMGYFHPIVAYGVERFVTQANAAGVDGLIVADLPVAHARADILPELAQTDIRLIPLSAPMLGADDIVVQSPAVGGFMYCIAAAGPTGGAAPTQQSVAAQVAKCRTLTDLPVAVGFGIKTPAEACAIAAHADGVVVGSALVETIAAGAVGDTVPAVLSAAVRDYVDRFRTALDRR